MQAAERKRLELGIFKTRKPVKEEEDNGQKSTPQTDEPSKEQVKTNSSRSPDHKKQGGLFTRKKKANECFAETRVDKKMISKETAHKTILIDSAPLRVQHEKVSLTVKAPQKTDQTNRPSSNDSESSTINSTTTCAQLVEQKLQEISQEVENLAAAASRNAVTSHPEECRTQRATSEVSSSLASEGYRTPEQSLRIEIATPPVTKPRQIFLSPNASLHLTPNSESSQSQRLPPPQPPPKPSVDLRLLAETTHWLIDEAKQSPGMQRVPAPEKNRESLADRLSKGIHDLTQGSSDRLQRWKTKLQNGNHTRRQKDQSEPPPMRRPPMRVMDVDSTAVPDWSDRYPRPLHPSRSASNALQINHFVSGQSFGREGMDHRTLKVRENSASQKDLSFHYHHMNSLQNIMNTLDGYTKNNFDCPPPRILPFSGVKPATDGLIRPVAFRPLASQNDDPAYPPGNDTRVERQVIRGDSTKSTTNMSQLVTTQLQKSRVMFQPSTSFTSQKPQENEYDTVPDYMEKEKMSDFGSSVSDYGSYHHVHQPTKMTSSTVSSGTHSSGSQLSSPPSSNKKTNYPTSGRVSALHVTPSPSDSGIVDYETLIRDKENELRVVRNTMEQNEEIIVKVYQEKERAWKEELEHLRSRLSASEKGENALRAQLAGCQKQTDNMSRTIDGLRDEKTGLLRKCFQLERELVQMKMELDKPRECDECRQRHSGPLSRRSQESSDVSLRGEVASLRDEVATLKEALTAQMQVFTDERKKWERENRSESNQVSIGRDRLI